MKEAARRNAGPWRRDGELMVQAVGPAVRVLCGLVAAPMLVFAVSSRFRGGVVGWLSAIVFIAMASPFGALAAFGWHVPVIDPVASERFTELADPARALTADDFASGTPEREPRPER
jgi:hypothetical protein